MHFELKIHGTVIRYLVCFTFELLSQRYTPSNLGSFAPFYNTSGRALELVEHISRDQDVTLVTV